MGEILKAVYEQQLDGVVTTLDEAEAARALLLMITLGSAPRRNPSHQWHLPPSRNHALTYFANASGATFPPDNTATMAAPVSVPRPRITAAVAAAPLGSATSRAGGTATPPLRQWPRRAP